MKRIYLKLKSLLKPVSLFLIAAMIFSSCQKSNDLVQGSGSTSDEAALLSTARSLEQSAPQEASNEGSALQISDAERNGSRNIVEIAIANPNFSSLVAAVVKTGLAGALFSPPGVRASGHCGWPSL